MTSQSTSACHVTVYLHDVIATKWVWTTKISPESRNGPSVPGCTTGRPCPRPSTRKQGIPLSRKRKNPLTERRKFPPTRYRCRWTIWSARGESFRGPGPSGTWTGSCGPPLSIETRKVSATVRLKNNLIFNWMHFLLFIFQRCKSS